MMMKKPGRRLKLALATMTAAALTAGMFGAASLSAVGATVDPPEESSEPALDWDNYERVQLSEDTGEAMDLAILPDGRILHTARGGELRLTDPERGTTTVTNTWDVYYSREDGLQTVTLSPDFAEDGWVYIYWSPLDLVNAEGETYQTPTGNAPTLLPEGADLSYWDQWQGYNLLTRYQWDEEVDALDIASGQNVFEIPAARGSCCHLGTDIAWDAEGNMYFSTGDNTNNAGGISGTGPNDDRPNANPDRDARKTSGSTNDLRGKVLRVTPLEVIEPGAEPGPGSTYSIPEGNLFDEELDTDDKTLPEIFLMGVRNPFRLDIDQESRTLSFGDYGPDAGDSTAYGPMGKVEWNVVSLDEPGNHGWPYCIAAANNEPIAGITGQGAQGHAYNDYDWATATAGEWHDCSAPVNESALNTGLTELPPVVPATAYYGDRIGDQPQAEFIDWAAGTRVFNAPMGGPMYRYDESNPSTSKFPEYWDGKWFFYEFDNNFISAMTLDGPAGELVQMEEILPNWYLEMQGIGIKRGVIDMEFGDDGALYTIEYQTRTLWRIAYAEDNRSPQAAIAVDQRTTGGSELTVAFDATASTDPDGDELTYEWDFDADGEWDSSAPQPTHTYSGVGAYTAILRVTDEGGKFSLANVQIIVGNTAPTIEVSFPENGTFFEWGEELPFEVTVTDAEDATIDCAGLVWSWFVGHNNHQHGEDQGTGCADVIATNPEPHSPDDDTFGVLEFEYTDGGNGDVPAATTRVVVKVNERDIQAEFAKIVDGVTLEDEVGAEAGEYVAGLGDGGHIAFEPVNFAGVGQLMSRARGDGEVQLRWGASDAEPFMTFDVDSAEWASTTQEAAGVPEGTGILYITATGDVDVDAVHANADLDIEAQVKTRCIGANAYLYVTAKNADEVAVDVTVTSPAGNKSIESLQPAKSLTAAFNTRSTGFEAGEIIIEARTTEGEVNTHSSSAAYDALTCG